MTSISCPMRKFIGSMGQSQFIDFASSCRPDKAFTPIRQEDICTLSLIHYRTFYDHSLWIAKTGLDAQQTNMDVIATTWQTLVPTVLSVSARCLKSALSNHSPAGGTVFRTNHLTSGLQIGTGVRPVATERLHSRATCRKPITVKTSRLKGRAFPGDVARWLISLYP